MTKKVTITVVPSADHPEYLTIQDAMLQIADAFTLLRGNVEQGFDWRLVSATTNSPLTAVGELVSAVGLPTVSAMLSVEESYQSVVDVIAGEAPTADLDTTVLKRVLARNTNGIGLTRIEFDDHPPVDITPTFAAAGITLLTAPEKFAPAPRRVRGSLEGELIDAGNYYHQPALKLRERLRGRILWCRIPENLQDQIANDTSIKDIWRNARVRLRGWIEYSPRGVVTGMSAERIQHLNARDVTAADLHDPDFTGGLDFVTYIDRLRDGDLG